MRKALAAMAVAGVAAAEEADSIVFVHFFGFFKKKIMSGF